MLGPLALGQWRVAMILARSPWLPVWRVPRILEGVDRGRGARALSTKAADRSRSTASDEDVLFVRAQ